ncbi:Mu-like prophage major head subunit gpT family protein [Algimonas porphyrae]|uniref:Head protein n=1 Tax=Algimonas porphyrae TaxID=1128113 RepID=A0ABQ5V014_9PROT|nr:Mu-like prophage major head subunit gpT family protein [Algimonas porphyrae]GLQ20499.1 head protein [Algimonas porphyrae]
MDPLVITPEILQAIRGGLRTEFEDVFSGIEPVWDRIATEVPSTTSGNNYGWLADVPDVREWIGERQIRELDEHAYRINNRLFESTVAVKRTSIEDGDLGSYTVRTRQIADKAAKHPDKLVFEAVKAGFTSRCFDGQNFFDTDHPVGPDGKEESVSNFQNGAGEAWYLLDTTAPLKPFIFQNRSPVEFDSLDGISNGSMPEHVFMKDQYVFGTRHRSNAGYGYWQLAFASKAPLTAANLKAARDAMQAYKSHSGETLGVMPNTLMVGIGNQSAAKELIGAAKINDAYNEFKDAFELIVAPQLN